MWRDVPESYNSTSGLAKVSAALSISADEVSQDLPSSGASSTSTMAAHDSSSCDLSAATFALSFELLDLSLSLSFSSLLGLLGPCPSLPPPFDQHSDL